MEKETWVVECRFQRVDVIEKEDSVTICIKKASKLK